MKKYLVSLSIATTLFFSFHTTAKNATSHPFANLFPHIIENGTQWKDQSVSTLNFESQLVYLNFLALAAQGLNEELKHCLQYIESNKEMHPVNEALFSSMINILGMYKDHIDKKIKTKKTLNKQEELALSQKLDAKMQELFAFIVSVYYQLLYTHMTKNNTQPLTYMFDANGLIPADKRTQSLPSSL